MDKVAYLNGCGGCVWANERALDPLSPCGKCLSNCKDTKNMPEYSPSYGARELLRTKEDVKF